MITRPLDLASRLRRAPRSADWVFYVNIGLIVLFFALFGSRFVLSPALAVNGENLRLPPVPEGAASLLPSSLMISVKANGQKFVVPNGLVSHEQLQAWMAERAQRTPGATILVRADRGVDFDEVAQISAAAEKAGLICILAAEPAKADGGVGQ
jgi:biopolymer transport protein ExbD